MYLVRSERCGFNTFRSGVLSLNITKKFVSDSLSMLNFWMDVLENMLRFFT